MDEGRLEGREEVWSCFLLAGWLLFQLCDCSPLQSLAGENQASHFILTDNFMQYEPSRHYMRCVSMVPTVGAH